MIHTQKFFELDGEQKLEAAHQMFSLSKKYNWPCNIYWESEENLKNDLEDDYDPDNHFTFYIIDEYGSIEVKIG